MTRQPNGEQEVTHDKVFPYYQEAYYNGKNNYGVQSQPNPYHWSLPKSDKNQQDDCTRNDSKNNYFIGDDTQESLSTKKFSSRRAAGPEEL